MHWSEKVPWERIILGIAVIWGFVAIINFMLTTPIPAVNKEIVLSMTAVLGTALGAVIGAVFRSNVGDETKNRTIETLANTAAAPLKTTTVETITNGTANPQPAGDPPVGGRQFDPASVPRRSDAAAGRDEEDAAPR